MNSAVPETGEVPIVLRKLDANRPAIAVVARTAAVIVAGTSVSFPSGVLRFDVDTPIDLAVYEMRPATDFAVYIYQDGRAIARPTELKFDSDGAVRIGGFHLAPGGNATGTAGGDSITAINSYSCWDLNFRPACADPRGMALVDGRFWADIYFTGAAHAKVGTSIFGQTIADARGLPPGVKVFDYETAKSALALHGKQLLGAEEFFAATYGVTERSAAKHEPAVTYLDAPRTSKYGLMQATGNMWTWGHDGHPDEPRAALFGGSWIDGQDPGSRCAYLVCWPGGSDETVGARGRSDHLIHG